MDIDVIIEDRRWKHAGLEALARTACAAVLERYGLDAASVSLMACDDARIATLNAEFRGKETPTNVLSWPSEERGAEEAGADPYPPEDLELGDIAIAYETCVREALEQEKDFADHVTHLLVHGTLHLLGYDHIREEDAVLMEGIETEILGNLGISDPYDETGR